MPNADGHHTTLDAALLERKPHDRQNDPERRNAHTIAERLRAGLCRVCRRIEAKPIGHVVRLT